jgi:DHA1 family bicyclomycin/chloramphenicol resistance-like MFS transporter
MPGFFFLAAMLAALAIVGPFTVDTYLPSFPAIGRDFGVSPVALQLTLSAYFFTFAAMTLLHGTLSDAFGRRPVILAGLVVYTLASAGCALSQDLAQLLVFRALQGMSAGAGMVVGRAMIRDSREGHDAQRLMSLVMLIFSLAPGIAPILGGFLLGWFGWRSIFVFLTGYAALLLVLTWRLLPETHPPPARQPFSPARLAGNYLEQLRSPHLVLLCFALALNFAGFFIYILSAPAFVYNILGLNEREFAWLIIPGVVGIMCGAFLSGRLAGRLTSSRTIAIAYVIMFSAAVFNVAFSTLAAPALPWSVLPMMIYATGMALMMPSASLLALDFFPHARGMTSSLLGFTQSLVSGIVAAVISPLLSHSAVTLAFGMTALLLLGCLAWVIYSRIGMRRLIHA